MVDLVTVSIPTVERRRDAILTRVLTARIGQLVQVDQLANSILAELPAGVTYDTAFESVRYLAGKPLQQGEAIRLAWRLAGNLDRLRTGQSVPPWSAQRTDEWVPMQVLKVVRTKNSKGKPGVMVTTRVLAGTPAPMKLMTFWNTGVAKYISSLIGFSKPWGAYGYRSAEELTGLRFYGLLDAERSRDKPEFHEVRCPDSMQKWNRDHVLRLRLRAGQNCPQGFTHRCTQCAFGYDQCPAGTHPKTYTLGDCSKCQSTDTLFDPDDATTIYCIKCAYIERMAKK